MKGLIDLHALLKQRSWDKEVILWLGPEESLLDACHSIHYVVLDLLDLFDPDNLPVDDEETHNALGEDLRQKLKALQKASNTRTVLVVRSIGLLARYKVGLKEFYDWFIGSHTLLALVLEGVSEISDWPEEIHCESRQILDYFSDGSMVKDVYAANG